MRDAYLLLRERGKGQPILLIIRKGVASTGVLHPVGVRDESPFAVGLPEMVPTVHEANNR